MTPSRDQKKGTQPQETPATGGRRLSMSQLVGSSILSDPKLNPAAANRTAAPTVPAPAAPVEATPEAPAPGSGETQAESDAKASRLARADSPQLLPGGARLLAPELDAILKKALPDEAADPKTIVHACEERLYAAARLQEAMTRATTRVYFEQAGPAVRLAYKTGSWREMQDPKTGKPFRAFRRWLESNEVSRAHGYRMLDVAPVAEALAPDFAGELTSKQVRVLAPILRANGPESIRAVWNSALQVEGNTQAPALEAARDRLNFASGPATEMDDGAPAPERLPVLQITAGSGRIEVDRVREIARRDPGTLRMFVQIASEVLAEVDGEA
jgi:hypothetical protein